MMNLYWKMTTEEREIVEENLGLVKKILKERFNRCYNIEKEDLMQIGTLGLIWAAHFYLKRKNEGEIIDCNFITFAWSRIIIYIGRELNTRKNSGKLVRIVKNFMGQFYLARGRNLSLREVGIIFEIDEKIIRETLNEYVADKNLDDVMEHESDTRPFIDDRLSPLDLLILKEEHLAKEAKKIRKRVARMKRLRNQLTTQESVL